MRLAAVLFGLALAGCGEPRQAAVQTVPLPPPGSVPEVVAPAPRPLSEEILEAHVAALTTAEMAGREAGAAGETAAARYVAARLSAHGVEAFGDALEQPFALKSGGESRNVIGLIRGRAPGYVVVGAHLDHLGLVEGAVHHGAEDNASGVAVVIELAGALVSRRAELGRSVIVAFFGAEEIGLQGSRHFVAQPPVAMAEIEVMVNVDMIGRRLVDRSGLGIVKKVVGIDDGASVGIIGTAGRPWLREAVDEACAAQSLRAWAPEDLPAAMGTMVERIAKDRGDNAPFEWAGIPTVFFSSGEFDEYHRPEDTADKLVFPLMSARARAIFATVVALSKTEIPAPEAANEGGRAP